MLSWETARIFKPIFFCSSFIKIKLTFKCIYLWVLQIRVFSHILKTWGLFNLALFLFPALTCFISKWRSTAIVPSDYWEVLLWSFLGIKIQYKLVYNLNFFFMLAFGSVIFTPFLALLNWQPQKPMPGDVGLIENLFFFLFSENFWRYAPWTVTFIDSQMWISYDSFWYVIRDKCIQFSGKFKPLCSEEGGVCHGISSSIGQTHADLWCSGQGNGTRWMKMSCHPLRPGANLQRVLDIWNYGCSCSPEEGRMQ